MAYRATLAVSEQFYSIQGEGQTIGIPSYFLRLTACNLMCGGKGTEKDGLLHDGASWRCDSIEVWKKGKHKTFDQIIMDFGGQSFINNLSNGAHIVITGGEPLIQQGNVEYFINYLNELTGGDACVEIETNGTIMPNKGLISRVQYWNVSPKLSNSGESRENRYKPLPLAIFNKLKGSIFKYVIANDGDFQEMLIDVRALMLDHRKIYLMPAGSTQDELAITSPMVADFAKEYCLNYSHRVHISIWNQKTGV